MVNLNVFHRRLSVLPCEAFPERREGTWKRYLSMTVGLELVKATKHRCQNPFCSVTQPETGPTVTLNTSINVWTHGDYIEIFTFRFTCGPLRLILISPVSGWHNSDISFLECQLYIGNVAQISAVIKQRYCSIKCLINVGHSLKRVEIIIPPETEIKCLECLLIWNEMVRCIKREKTYHHAA